MTKYRKLGPAASGGPIASKFYNFIDSIEPIASFGYVDGGKLLFFPKNE